MQKTVWWIWGVLTLAQNLAGCAIGRGSADPDVVRSAEAFLGAYAEGNKPAVGGRPEVMVRVATVWRLSNGAWLLVQSSNVVPSVGQSSDVILRKARQ